MYNDVIGIMTSYSEGESDVIGRSGRDVIVEGDNDIIISIYCRHIIDSLIVLL